MNTLSPIAATRQRLGLSQAQLAAIAGTSGASISRAEHGRVGIDLARTLASIPELGLRKEDLRPDIWSEDVSGKASYKARNNPAHQVSPCKLLETTQ